MDVTKLRLSVREGSGFDHQITDQDGAFVGLVSDRQGFLAVARLFSKSPALLDACENAIEALEGFGVSEVIVQLQDAVNQARGVKVKGAK